MILKNTISAFILVLMITLLGCSNSRSPVTSPDILQDLKSSDTKLPVGVTDILPDGSFEGYGVVGLYELNLNPDEINAELTPLRNITLTDVLEIVDITYFLKLAPCQDCAKIKSISLDSDGNLIVSIGIKHPFPVGDSFKPISGRNRGDLHVFNVEGTIVSSSTGDTFPGIGMTTSAVKLLNADGYSPYLDSVLDDIYPTDANIHPYITHFDDYSQGNFDASNPMGFESVTTPPPSGNLVMAMGCDYNYQDYVFSADIEQFDLTFAIGCTYAVSAASKIQRFTPEYRIPQHNKKAASEVAVEVISNDLNDSDVNSSAEIEVRVVDISHDVEVGDALNQMLSASNVGSISIEIPGILGSPSMIDGSNPLSGTGHDPTDPLVYRTTINNEQSAGIGIYQGLVKVTDTYSPGQNQSPLLNGMDGIERVDPISNPLAGLFAISEFATYATFTIDVVGGNEPPVAILEPDPASCDMGDSIDFDGTNSYDPDGTIILYEFDFDWDGVEANFVADESNTTGLATSFPYPIDGNYTSGLRVTDDFGEKAYDSVTVTVAHIDVIYVDDSNTSGIESGTMTYPFNTIQEGLAAAPSGYQVWVDDSGNNYSGPVTTKADVILKSVNWAASDGDYQADIWGTTGYIVNAVAYSTIDGFKVHGTSTSGVALTGQEAQVKNCLITGIKGSSGIVTVVRAGSAPGALLENCEITDCELNTVQGGILNVVYIYDSPMTIRGCNIHDNRKTEDAGIINIIYVASCEPMSGFNLEIYHNKIYDIDFQNYGFINGIYVSSYTSDAEIHNNLLYDFDMISGGMAIGIYLSQVSNIQMYNNVFHDFQNDTWCTGFYVDAASTNLASYNNIVSFMHNSSNDPVGWGVYFSTSNISWNYNDVYQVGYPTVPSGTGNLAVDPEFVNPGADYHLAAGSPCIDAGDPSVFDPDSSVSDMGCYGGPDGNW